MHGRRLSEVNSLQREFLCHSPQFFHSLSQRNTGSFSFLSDYMTDKKMLGLKPNQKHNEHFGFIKIGNLAMLWVTMFSVIQKHNYSTIKLQIANKIYLKKSIHLEINAYNIHIGHHTENQKTLRTKIFLNHISKYLRRK